MSNGNVNFLYDSSSKDNTELLPKWMHSVEIITVPKQNFGTNDCGVYLISFAENIMDQLREGKTMHQINEKFARMRITQLQIDAKREEIKNLFTKYKV